MENACSTSNLSRIGWLKTLEDLGYQARFIHRDHLLGGALEREGFKVLILNRALCLSDAEAAAIQSFGRKGGLVLADHLTGLFDEHGKARGKGALDDFFGVRHDLGKGILGGGTLTEVDAEKDQHFSEKSWAGARGPLYKGMAVFERGLGSQGAGQGEMAQDILVRVRSGPHVWFNVSPAGYLLKRATPGAQEWLAEIASHLKRAGLEPRLRISLGGAPASVTESIFWKNGNRMTLCVVQNLDRKAEIDSFGATQGNLGEGALKVKLSFAVEAKSLVNERTGRAMGDGKSFEDDFTPWEANVYTYTP